MSEKFPGPVYADGIRKSTQTRFGGLNHNPGAGDGELYAMKNLGSDFYPLMSTREKRGKNATLYRENNVTAIFSGRKLSWISGGEFVTKNKNNYEMRFYGLTTGRKTIAEINNITVIFPDKAYYDRNQNIFGRLDAERTSRQDDELVYSSIDRMQNHDSSVGENAEYQVNNVHKPTGVQDFAVGDIVIQKDLIKTWTFNGSDHYDMVEVGAGVVTNVEYVTASVINLTVQVESGKMGKRYVYRSSLYRQGAVQSVTFGDGTLYGESAEANTITLNDANWSSYFREGDAITIEGSEIEENNGTFIVREIDGDEMRFYEHTFTNGTDTGTNIVFRRTVPDLEFVFECGNRIWGCYGQTLCASKIGDPFNFNVFDGLESDSWATSIGGGEDFAGGIEFQNYPTLLSGDALYKVFGSAPSNFELVKCSCTGLEPGSKDSLAIVNEMLFYLSRNGVCMYAGGLPTVINRSFGTERYRNAVAGSDGLKYYVSMQDSEDVWHFFVYDTQRDQWHEEDNTQVYGFAYWNGTLHYVDAAIKKIQFTGNPRTWNGYITTEEEDFEWYAEFTDFTDDSPNKKGISKIQIRADLDVGATCTVKLMIDSSGDWITPKDGTIEENGKRSYYLAIIPQRADHYRMRIEGRGGCKIYSITREYYVGSELKSQPGRQ